MNKKAIEAFTLWARKEITKDIYQQAFLLGFTKDGIKGDGVLLSGRPMDKDEQRLWTMLKSIVVKDGLDATIDRAAYTWFNRLVALRFMEVNDFLPTRVRVLSGIDGETTPQIMREVYDIDIEGLDRAKVLSLLSKGRDEEAYRLLLVTQCHALASSLHGIFGGEACFDILLPEGLLRKDGIIARLVSDISEEDFKDQVQIVGWIYQYYNEEVKDDTYAQLKKGKKVEKDRIPSVTQLFTPDWIVRYMVENSLGRIWCESHPSSTLRQEWRYYIDEAKQEPKVEQKLQEERKKKANLNPEEITILDPCCGSGHILVYAFDVLMGIYRECGYSDRDATRLIVEKNLYGLDIDDRAAQLASFAVTMKARQYDRRFLERDVTPNVMAIPEAVGIPKEDLDLFSGTDSDLRYDTATLVEAFREGKTLGSLIEPPQMDESKIRQRIVSLKQSSSFDEQNIAKKMEEVQRAAVVLSTKYDCVITNPPYLNSRNMNPLMLSFVKNHFSEGSEDLFSCFIEKCLSLAKTDGYCSMLTMQSWMFLSGLKPLRKFILANKTIINMAHLGSHGFDELGGEVVQTTAFVFQNQISSNYLGTYCRLVDYTSEEKKSIAFTCLKNRFFAKQDSFHQIPGEPIAYWANEKLIHLFMGHKLTEFAKPLMGISTGDNDIFLRLWWEPSVVSINFHASSRSTALDSKLKWFPYSKGGQFRKWYGNCEYVVNWENDGESIRNFKDKKGKLRSRPQNLNILFLPSVTWSLITSTKISFRYRNIGFVYGDAGPGLFSNSDLEYPLLGFLNTKIIQVVVDVLNPTINLSTGVVSNFPCDEKCINFNIIQLTKDLVNLSRLDWDSLETSWDFKRSPLL